MQISHLRELIVLAQNHSFTQTATQLYTTQSAVSKHMQALEQDIGAQLLLRDHNGGQLTDAGKVFIEYAKRIVHDYDEGLMALSGFNAGLNRTINIGYLAGAASAFLPQVTERFLKLHPETNLQFFALEIDEALAGLENDKYDLVVTTEYVKLPRSVYHVEELYHDRVAVIVPRGHRLASHESVRVDDLSGENVIISTPSFLIREAPMINNLIKPVLDKITVVQSANDIWSLFLLLDSGCYVTILFQHLKNYSDYAERFAFLPLEEAPGDFDIVAVWKRSENAEVLQELADLLKQVIAEKGVS